MIRISRNEWSNIISILNKLSLNIKAGGGGISGNYRVYLDGKLIALHQFEYEEYYEMDEAIYKQYLNLDLSRCNQ